MLDIRDFGADPTGTSSSAAALQNAINAALASVGSLTAPYQGVDGIVSIPTGNFWIDKQITIPNSGGSNPRQRALRIVGAGVGFSAGGTNYSGQSVLRMTAGTRGGTDGAIPAQPSAPGLANGTGGTILPGTYSFEYTFYNASGVETSPSLTSSWSLSGLTKPVAPTVQVNASGGSGFIPTTYYCLLTYTNTYGESLASPVAAAVISASNQEIQVSPPVAGSATGWRCYLGTAPNGPFYLQGSTQTNFSTPLILTTPQTGTATPPTTNTTGQYKAIAVTSASLPPGEVGINVYLVSGADVDGNPANPGLVGSAAGTGLTVTTLPSSAGALPGFVLTSASQITFTQSDVGSFVRATGPSGPALGAGTVVLAYVSSGQVTLSAPPLYAGSNLTVSVDAPKIVTTGASGQLAIEHLTLTGGTQAGTDTAPFIQTTGTVLHLEDVTFVGTGNPRAISDGAVQVQPAAPGLSAGSGGLIPAGTYTLEFTYYGTASAPPQPVAIAPSGGGVPLGTYYIVTTYVTAAGGETTGSVVKSVQTTTGFQTILVSSPPAPAAPAIVVRWKSYIGTASAGPYYVQNSAASLPIGTSLALTTAPAGSGSQPPGTNNATFESVSSLTGSKTTGSNATITVMAPALPSGYAGVNAYLVSGGSSVGLVGSAASNQVVVSSISSPTGVPPPSSKLVSYQANFSSFDVGAPVAGVGLPPGSYISSVLSATTAALSQPVNATASGLSLGILSSFQDAVVLGGTAQGPLPNNAQFSGYGSIIEKCSFSYVRRAAFYRAAANGVTFRDNTINNSCSGGPMEAAVDLDGAPYSLAAQSNLIAGNIIQLQWYVNGIRLNNAQLNTIVNNYIGDPFLTPAMTANAILMTPVSAFNIVMGGTYQSALSDNSYYPNYPGHPAYGVNTVLAPTSSPDFVFPQPVVFRAGLVTYGASNSFQKLAMPAGPRGTGFPGGTTTYQYQVTALNWEGIETAVPTSQQPFSVTNASQLSATVYNQISIPAVAGATSYRIYGRSGSPLPLLAQVAANGSTTTWNDYGQAAVNPPVYPSTTTAGTELVVQGWDYQTGDLQVWQQGSTFVVGRVNINGILSINGVTGLLSLPPYWLDINLAGQSGIRLYANSTYDLTTTGGLQVWALSQSKYPPGTYIDGGPNSIFLRQGSGALTAMTVPSSGSISITPTAAATVGLIVNNAQTSPTGDLLQLQNNGSNVGKVDIGGTLHIQNIKGPTPIGSSSFLIGLETAGGTVLTGYSSYNVAQSGAIQVWALGTTYAGMYLDAGPNSIYFRQGTSTSTVAMTVPSSGAISITPTAAATVGLVINNAQSSPTGDLLQLQSSGSNVAKVDINGRAQFANYTDSSGTGGQVYCLQITPNYNQTGNANATDLLINRTGTAGGGTQRLIDAQVAGASKFRVDNKGSVTFTGNIASSVVSLSGSTVTPDASQGVYQKITVSGASPMIANPTNFATGDQLVLDIYNSTSGTVTITFGSAYKVANAPWPSNTPGFGKRRTVSFYYDGTNWVEMSRGTADIT